MYALLSPYISPLEVGSQRNDVSTRRLVTATVVPADAYQVTSRTEPNFDISDVVYRHSISDSGKTLLQHGSFILPKQCLKLKDGTDEDE